jgi:hypothetical protein
MNAVRVSFAGFSESVGDVGAAMTEDDSGVAAAVEPFPAEAAPGEALGVAASDAVARSGDVVVVVVVVGVVAVLVHPDRTIAMPVSMSNRTRKGRRRSRTAAGFACSVRRVTLARSHFG